VGGRVGRPARVGRRGKSGLPGRGAGQRPVEVTRRTVQQKTVLEALGRWTEMKPFRLPCSSNIR